MPITVEEAIAACTVAGTPQPELEPLLASTATSAYWYAHDILKGEFPAGEEAIADDAAISTWYAFEVLKKRFIKGEPTIGKSTYAMSYYRRFKSSFPDGRFVHGEQSEYLSSPKDIIDYVLASQQRFVEGEERLIEYAMKSAENIKYLVLYCRHTNFRHKTFENLIAEDPQASLDYAINNKARFKQGEANIANSTPAIAMLYTQEVLKSRFKEAEKLISKDANASYYYAREVLKDRFPEAEGVIARSSTMALHYAKDVIKGRFHEGEKYIAKDATCSFLYAQSIMKGRFPEGEKTILRDQKFTDQYRRMLKQVDSFRLITLCTQCYYPNLLSINKRVCVCCRCKHEFDLDNPAACTRKVKYDEDKYNKHRGVNAKSVS